MPDANKAVYKLSLKSHQLMQIWTSMTRIFMGYKIAGTRIQSLKIRGQITWVGKGQDHMKNVSPPTSKVN